MTKGELIQAGVVRRKELYGQIKEVLAREKAIRTEFKNKLDAVKKERLELLTLASKINEKIKYTKGLLLEDPSPDTTLEALVSVDESDTE